jgi:hypothetical protein
MKAVISDGAPSSRSEPCTFHMVDYGPISEISDISGFPLPAKSCVCYGRQRSFLSPRPIPLYLFLLLLGLQGLIGERKRVMWSAMENH